MPDTLNKPKTRFATRKQRSAPTADCTMSEAEAIPLPPDVTAPRRAGQLAVSGAISACPPKVKRSKTPQNTIKGLDLMRLGNDETIVGWIFCYKAPCEPAEQPYASETELALAYYLEYHPLVAWFQRGDTKPTFNQLRSYATRWTTPFVIPYYFEDVGHEYWPDWVGELTTGELLIAEAGHAQQKKEPKEQAKLAAARYFAHARGGVFWLGLESQLKGFALYNRARLHVWRDVKPQDDNLVLAIRHCWQPGARRSIEQICEELEGRWSQENIQAVAWKTLADAVAGGHAIVDQLDEAPLDLTTEVSLTGASAPVILPTLSLADRVDEENTANDGIEWGTGDDPSRKRLPAQWISGSAPAPTMRDHQVAADATGVFDETPIRDADCVLNAMDVTESDASVRGAPSLPNLQDPATAATATTLHYAGISPLVDAYGRSSHLSDLTGSVFDVSLLPDTTRTLFYHRLDMVRAIGAGASIRSIAERNDIHYETLYRLLQRYRAFGEIALLPRALYIRATRVRTHMRPEFAQLALRLFRHSQRLSIRQVAEHPRMNQLARSLSKREGVSISLPSYDQVHHFLRHQLTVDPELRAARSGERHPQEPRTSLGGFIARLLHYGAAGLLLNVDVHDIDMLVCLPSGLVVSRKIWGAALLDVATGAVLAAMVSLSALTEWDYLELVKMAMEDKVELSALMGCVNRWECRARPAIIMSDRGRIFISDYTREVLVRRFHITEEIAPPYVPPIKGAVEAAFRWITERVEHRLPGTTKGSPRARGQYDAQKEAAKAGITTDDLRRYWIRAWVDGYMAQFDSLRNGAPADLWRSHTQRWGVRQWDDSTDALKLLMMKVVNHKYPDKPQRGFNVYPANTLSVWGDTYVAQKDVRQHAHLQVRASGQDVRVIYLFDDHNRLVTEAYHTELALSPFPISLAERKRFKADQRQRGLGLNQASADALTQIVADAHASPAEKRRARMKAEHAREKQRQRRWQDIHTDQAQAMLDHLALLSQSSAIPQGIQETEGRDRAASKESVPSTSNHEVDMQAAPADGGLSLLPPVEPRMDRRTRRGSAPPPFIRFLSRTPTTFAPAPTSMSDLPDAAIMPDRTDNKEGGG